MSGAARPISMATAHRIWSAWREIEVAQKLLHDIDEALKSGSDPTPLDGFGRRSRYTLGVPISESSHRLLDVSPQLASVMIQAHIANKETELAEATHAACLDMAP